ncbi:protein serine/threonine phosphatase [[Leptolyngbya] sp. PCC 7376]|uniref:PP2C family protein-serine/threonine phosphatase n=1 Tax=[Leptolyngbya] sp. PCC 7376 TaxID=111781 RepID=UPI00029F0F2A|nr:PP2C family serine/threonine-protein phosphatase [[Leptolyngbya] sp. PCC 7376]AFY40416.1 protein serine/threonine phosphatase [[Leptolyngbya] sp. PCC 7376]
MDISKVTISCTKSDCSGRSPLHHSHCNICQTPVLKRYLHVLAAPEDLLAPQTFLADRYLVTDIPNIVLDTQPHYLPVVTDNLPAEIETYLKLSTHLLHCPKVFGLTQKENGHWLLEYPSVTLTAEGLPQYPALFLSIREAWPSAEPLQQLNWLGQMAGMLPTFLTEGVAGTFDDLSLLGVNGGVVQIRQLLFDRNRKLDFQELAQAWQELLGTADKSIEKFCRRLYKELIQGKINKPQQLQNILTAGIEELGRSHYKYKYSLYTQTDSGPTRDHNEDACFPESGKVHSNFPLAIVCDGIGGHDKGEVASAIAISTLAEQLLIEDPSTLNPAGITEAVYAANDAITACNDEENRRERERMGTTVVLALTQKPNIHLCHVGDSRIYRVTSESCHQVTYDDDLGSREVRLGYALYQDVLSYPSAGALVQALGMNPSQSLHPTTQTFAVDCDTVYLLCSDGLSDYGKVEQYWQSEIVPLLSGNKAINDVGENLIEIANTKNGHDNSTIALLHIQLKRQKAVPISFPEDLEGILNLPVTSQQQNAPYETSNKSNNAPPPQTQPSVAPRRKQKANWLLLCIGLLGIGGIGLLSYEMWRRLQSTDIIVTPPEPDTPIIEPKPISEEPVETPTIAIPDPDELEPEEETADALTKNQIVRLQSTAPVIATYTPQAIADTEAPTVWIPGGSVAQIKQVNTDGNLLLEVCLVGEQTPPDTSTKILAKGNRGWSQPDQVETQQDLNFVVTSDIETLCQTQEAPVLAN